LRLDQKAGLAVDDGLRDAVDVGADAGLARGRCLDDDPPERLLARGGDQEVRGVPEDRAQIAAVAQEMDRKAGRERLVGGPLGSVADDQELELRRGKIEPAHGLEEDVVALAQDQGSRDRPDHRRIRYPERFAQAQGLPFQHLLEIEAVRHDRNARGRHAVGEQRGRNRLGDGDDTVGRMDAKHVAAAAQVGRVKVHHHRDSRAPAGPPHPLRRRGAVAVDEVGARLGDDPARQPHLAEVGAWREAGRGVVEEVLEIVTARLDAELSRRSLHRPGVAPEGRLHARRREPAHHLQQSDLAAGDPILAVMHAEDLDRAGGLRRRALTAHPLLLPDALIAPASAIPAPSSAARRLHTKALKNSATSRYPPARANR